MRRHISFCAPIAIAAATLAACIPPPARAPEGIGAEEENDDTVRGGRGRPLVEEQRPERPMKTARRAPFHG